MMPVPATLDRIDWTSPLNRDSPLNRGLVAWWFPAGWLHRGRMTELVNRQHATITGSTPHAAWVGSSEYPSVWRLDGSDDHAVTADLPAVDFSGTQPFTHLVVLRTTGTPASNYAPLMISETGQNATLYDKGIIINSSGVPGMYWFDGAQKAATGPAACNNGRWRMLAGVFNGAEGRCYLDGVSGTAVASTSTFNFASPQVVLGFARPTGNPAMIVFPGDILEARTWNRALSAAEVRAAFLDWRSHWADTLQRRPFRLPVLFSPDDEEPPTYPAHILSACGPYMIAC